MAQNTIPLHQLFAKQAKAKVLKALHKDPQNKMRLASKRSVNAVKPGTATM
jgi:hypothetical protein